MNAYFMHAHYSVVRLASVRLMTPNTTLLAVPVDDERVSPLHISQDQLDPPYPSEKLALFPPKHSGCSYLLGFGPHASLVPELKRCSTIVLVSVVGRGLLHVATAEGYCQLACKAHYARDVLSASPSWFACAAEALASLVRAPLGKKAPLRHMTYCNRRKFIPNVLAALRMHWHITTLPSTIFRNRRHAVPGSIVYLASPLLCCTLFG